MGRTLLFYAVMRGERTTYVCARERRLAHQVPNLLSLGDAADCVGRAQPGARPCLGLSVCRWSWSFTTRLPLKKRLLRVFILPRTYLVPGPWYYYNLTIIAFAPFRIGLVCTEAALFHSRKTKTPTLFEFAFRSTFNKKLKKHVSGECSACSSCVENSTTRNERKRTTQQSLMQFKERKGKAETGPTKRVIQIKARTSACRCYYTAAVYSVTPAPRHTYNNGTL